MRTILLLLLIILHTQIQAQTTRIENDLFAKVVTKFKKDKESFGEFKYLGLCHWAGLYLYPIVPFQKGN